ncbi:MAG: FtsX-like permease family protein [Bryobacterales bacterium]|nr:FtsX-like permease family protein [Bryobacterales bacterium]
MTQFKLFYRMILRPLRQERLRTVIAVLSVALGVAAVLAIELAGDAAAGSFRSSMETLLGDAAFEVTAGGGVPPETVARLAMLPYPIKIHPRMEAYAVIPPNHRAVPLLGVDLVAESMDTQGALEGAGTVTEADSLESGDSIWVGRGLGYKTGDRVHLTINDTSSEYTIRGILPESAGDIVLMDLATAARVLHHHGKLDRILIDVPNVPSMDKWETILRAALPNGLTIAREGTQTEENRRLLSAFRWNLRVLSYVSLAVGAFLIFNTISVSVVRRRFEIGVVRALGLTRAAILAAFLGEAAAFGLIGAMVGIVLGRLMAIGAVGMVAATIQSLYVSSRPGAISLTWTDAWIAVAIGVDVSMISALSPAWEASLVPPAEAMARGRREHQARVHSSRDLIVAAVFGACAWIASRQAPVDGKPVFGYLAAVLLIGASASAIPALVAGVSAASGGLMRVVFGVEALLATRGVAGSLRRSSVLVGALSTALAMLVAVGIMVGSFRETVMVWMDDRLQADLYLGPAGPQGTDQHATLSAEIPRDLAKLPDVAAVDTLRAYEISYGGLPVTLGGVEARVAGANGKRPLLSGAQPARVWPQLVGRDAVLVSEPFANKHNVHAGDTLTLPLGSARIPFRVLDVYYDYSNERGFILMDRGTLLKYLPDAGPSNVAVYLKPHVPAEQGRREVQSALAGRQVLISSNRSLRQEAIRIFDRTFAVTYALEAVAVFVAIMGVGGALLAVVIDRRREFGLLNFLGASQGQVRRIILFEAGFFGLLANIAGLILGFLLSLLLIFVINKQSFGWTIQFHWPVTVLLGGLFMVYVVTVLAGVYPARVATRLIPIEVIHEE